MWPTFVIDLLIYPPSNDGHALNEPYKNNMQYARRRILSVKNKR